MILLDQSSIEGVLIGIQKSDKTYTYLHWSRKDSLFKGQCYHAMLAGNYKDIEGIGPTILVSWPPESYEAKL